MTFFNEDKLFKGVQIKDASILLDILGKKSETIRMWTREMRMYDPRDFRPDIILELDDENLIIEIQSTKIDYKFKLRALHYVLTAESEKENDNEVNLMVISTAEESKEIEYNIGRINFAFDVVSLKDLDVESIIGKVEPKINSNQPIDGKELVMYSLIPLSVEKNKDKYINSRTVHNLLQLKHSTVSLKGLAYGIGWLIVDKFIKDEEHRNILCDALGGNMTLIEEYGQRRFDDGFDNGFNDGEKSGRKKAKKNRYGKR